MSTVKILGREPTRKLGGSSLYELSEQLTVELYDDGAWDVSFHGGRGGRSVLCGYQETPRESAAEVERLLRVAAHAVLG